MSAGVFDTAIVFSYGWAPSFCPRSDDHLNIYSRVSVLAAGTLYRVHYARRLVLTGTGAGGELAAMHEVLRTRFNIPNEDLAVEEAASTLESLILAANAIDRAPERHTRICFVALGFHRACILEMCAWLGIEGEFFSAENTVAARYRKYHDMPAQLRRLRDGSYVHMVATQDDELRRARTMPEYHLAPMARLTHEERQRRACLAVTMRDFSDARQSERQKLPGDATT